MDYMSIEKDFNKNKKFKKLSIFLLCCVAVVSGAFGFMGNTTAALSCGIFGSMIMLPCVYYFGSKMHEIFNRANKTNITYKQFKQIQKNGELDKLKQEVKELMYAPASVGIEKITLNTSKNIQHQTNQKQKNLTYSKNLDGRNN